VGVHDVASEGSQRCVGIRARALVQANLVTWRCHQSTPFLAARTAAGHHCSDGCKGRGGQGAADGAGAQAEGQGLVLRSQGKGAPLPPASTAARRQPLRSGESGCTGLVSCTRSMPKPRARRSVYAGPDCAPGGRQHEGLLTPAYGRYVPA